MVLAVKSRGMRLVLFSAIGFFACAHGAANEARLEAAPRDDAEDLRCRPTSPEITIAHDETAARAERLSRFDQAIAEASRTALKFDAAFKRDPDLLYGVHSDEWKQRQHDCEELARRLERERVLVDRLPEMNSAPATPVVAAADAAFEAPSEKLIKPYKKKVAHAKKKHGKSVRLAAR
jgi:hypothetical protein